jgi:hypothetical protein
VTPVRERVKREINTLNAELNPISHLLTLLGAHPIFHISRIRVKDESIEKSVHGEEKG